jgi:hypothetical protein
MAPLPSLADDNATTGILAGLGLSAADGKTTVSNSGGAIEASVLGSDAFDQAGAIIAAAMNKNAAGKRVLVLAHDETFDLTQPEIVKERIAAVASLYNGAACNDKKLTPPPAPAPGRVTPQVVIPGLGTLQPKDIVGAIATDTAISGLTLTGNDRLLIAAILLNRRANGSDNRGDDDAAMTWKLNPPVSSGTPAKYIIPGELTAPAITTSAVYKAYKALLGTEEKKRGGGCDSAAIKAAMIATDALATSLNAPADKSGPSPLINAIQLEAAGGTQPLILRVAIEQIGGTTITKSGVLYTLGLPGASRVSSGLLVSFRLDDPATGEVKSVGLVRCITAPSNLRKAHDTIVKGKTAMACSYRLG